MGMSSRERERVRVALYVFECAQEQFSIIEINLQSVYCLKFQFA